MEKYKLTIIGLCFTVLGFIALCTVVAPYLFVKPAASVMLGIFNEYGDKPFNTIGWSIVTTLAIAFILISILFYSIIYWQAKKRNKSNTFLFILFLIIQCFIVYPLGVYINFAAGWDLPIARHEVITLRQAFGCSAIGFIFLGVLADLIKNRFIISK